MTLGISQGWGFPKSGLSDLTYSYSYLFNQIDWLIDWYFPLDRPSVIFCLILQSTVLTLTSCFVWFYDLLSLPPPYHSKMIVFLHTINTVGVTSYMFLFGLLHFTLDLLSFVWTQIVCNAYTFEFLNSIAKLLQVGHYIFFLLKISKCHKQSIVLVCTSLWCHAHQLSCQRQHHACLGQTINRLSYGERHWHFSSRVPVPDKQQCSFSCFQYLVLQLTAF